MKDTAQQMITRKIGQNKGKPRLWIEGKALIDAGMDHGNRWNKIAREDGFDIERADDGKRKISGKPGRPVIDISGAGLGVVADATEVIIEISDGLLRVYS